MEFWQTIATPLIVGVLLTYFQHINNKRYDAQDRRAELRKKESLISLELAEANAKLSYACAMALKRGTANGEVEEALTAYNKALKDKEDFLKEATTEYVSKGER